MHNHSHVHITYFISSHNYLYTTYIFFFFFNHTPTTEIYTLSLHDALPILENAPYGVVEEGLFHQLFPKDHPYYGEVIGSHQDIQSAKLEDVRNFFKLYYAPNNASLAIVGDFDPEKARELVQKYFGPLKRGEDVPKIKAHTPPIPSERRAVIQDNVQLPRVYMAWLT